MSQSEILFNSTWNGSTSNEGHLTGKHLSTKLTIPNMYAGTEPGTNPKELLISAATSCYFMTLVAMLEQRKLPITKIEMSTFAINADNENLKISHFPTITLSQNASQEHLDISTRTMNGADKACAIGNMLRKADVEITVTGKTSLSDN